MCEPGRPSLALRETLAGLLLGPTAEEACECVAHDLLILDRDEGGGDAVVELKDEADLWAQEREWPCTCESERESV